MNEEHAYRRGYHEGYHQAICDLEFMMQESNFSREETIKALNDHWKGAILPWNWAKDEDKTPPPEMEIKKKVEFLRRGKTKKKSPKYT